MKAAATAKIANRNEVIGRRVLCVVNDDISSEKSFKLFVNTQ